MTTSHTASSSAFTQLLATVVAPDGDFGLTDEWNPSDLGSEVEIDMMAQEAVAVGLLPHGFLWWYDSESDVFCVTLDVSGGTRLTTVGTEMRKIAGREETTLDGALRALVNSWEAAVASLMQRLANTFADSEFLATLPSARTSR